MVKAKTQKTDRIEIRVNKQTKQLIEKAADILGESTSSYILRHSIESAIEDINKYQSVSLGDKDSKIFADLISNPPKPNNALKNLMRS